MGTGLERIEEELHVLKEQVLVSPTLLLADASRPERRNPFRLIRAEEFNHDYRKLAQVFHEPERYDDIAGRRPVMLIGGRGSGKSMILRCLCAEAQVERARTRLENPATRYADSDLDYFGVYVKLAKGFFPAERPCVGLDLEAMQTLFQHYLNMQLTEALVTTLERSSRLGVVDISMNEQKAICEEIGQLVEPETTIATFADLRMLARRQKSAVGNYVSEVTLPQPSAERYNGVFTHIHEYPESLCETVTNGIRELNGSRVYFLMDEFENLLAYQQQVIFTLMKLAPFSLSVKIAVRTDLGMTTNVDLQDQPLQDRDAPAIRLDYDPGSQSYRDLLKEIARRRLRSEGYVQEDITQLLQPFALTEDLDADALQEELARHLSDRGESIEELSVERVTELHHNLDVGLVFRRLHREGRMRGKAYGGFETFAMLSSGIVSNFMELCKMAIYFAEQDGVAVADGAVISVPHQTRAANTVSEALLRRIASDVPTHGEALRQLVIDLGDILQSRLLQHPSEPEAARLTLTDAQNILRAENAHVKEMIDAATEWSMLQEVVPTSAYRPRHRSDVRPSEWILNRIYAPALQISYRARWRCEVATSQLASLLDPDRREEAVATLSTQLVEEGGPTLFDTPAEP